MLTMLQRRLRRDEDGFTLIELMVVVLIIAILIAIAIPTFLGAQDRARDRGAQSDLRNALTAAKTLATDNAGLLLDADGAVLDAVDLEAAEGSLDFDDLVGDNDTILVVDDAVAPIGEELVLAMTSASGTAFCIATTDEGAVTYGSGAAIADVDTMAECADAEW